MKSRSSPFLLLAALPFAGACFDDPAEHEEVSALDTNNPGFQIGAPFSPSALAWHWTGVGSADDPTRCRDCATTPTTNPATEVNTSHTSLAAYVSALGGWPLFPGGTAAPPTPFVQAAAAGDAILASPTTDNVSKTLTDVKGDFDLIIALVGGTGTATLEPPVTTPWVVGFPKVQGRHVQTDFVRVGAFDELRNYGLPGDFSELRMRGAKTFCAARSAAFALDGHKADDYALYDHHDLDFLWWQTGVTGASLRMLPSAKFLDRDNEAFSIPLQLSSRLAPLSGPVMPNFGELVHPLVWLTADRERTSLEDFGTVRIGICRPGTPICIGANVPTYRKLIRNLEHDDAMAGTAFEQRLDIDNIQVVNWGFFSLRAGGYIDVETGKVQGMDPFAPATGRVEAFGAFPSLPLRSSVFDDVLTPSSVAADAPLALNGPFVAIGGHSSVTTAPTSPAAITRWRNDDDRAITVTDRITEAVDLNASAGFALGPVDITVNGESKVEVTSQQDIAIREQLSLAKRSELLPPVLDASDNVAQTNLVAVPHSKTTYTLNPLAVTMTFKLDIETFFGTIHLDWTQPFFTLPSIPLGAPDEYGGLEAQRIRIGEYSDAALLGGFDGASQRPRSVSYLAGREPFEAFPSTVQACLADPTPLPPPGPPPARTPTSGPVHGHVCAVGPGDYNPNPNISILPDHICGDPANPGDHSVRDEFAREASISWASNSTDPAILVVQQGLEVSCISQVIDFVCRPTSIAVSPTSRSHVLTLGEGGEYGALVKSCTTAFTWGTADPVAAKAIGELVGSKLIPLVACHEDGSVVPI